MPELPDILDAWFAICAYEAAAAHKANYPSRADEYGAYFREILKMGSGVTDAAYAEASEVRSDYSDRFRAVLSTVDAIASPAGGVPFPMSQELQYGSMADFAAVRPNVQMRFTTPADFAGTPTISLPCGVSDDGLPYTIQFLGSHLSEAMLCRVGHAYEQVTAWHTRHPNV